jgi:hypothetical protein
VERAPSHVGMLVLESRKPYEQVLISLGVARSPWGAAVFASWRDFLPLLGGLIRTKSTNEIIKQAACAFP